MADQKYRVWSPLAGIPRRLWLEAIHDDVEGLRLLLRAKDPTGPTLRVLFESVVAYRNINESFRLRSWARMRNFGNLPTLMKVDSSEWIGRIVEDAAGVLEAESLVHYAIYTPEDCVDVVTMEEPTAEWLNA